VIVVALISGFIGIYDITKVSDVLGGVSNDFVHASIGIGLYAVLAGAAIAFFGGISGRPTDPLPRAEQATGPTFMSTGTRYLLGYTLDPPSYGIWDREAVGPPFERFPYSEHGKVEATDRFNQLERTLVPPEQPPDL
jgi:hypothetical protein